MIGRVYRRWIPGYGRRLLIDFGASVECLWQLTFVASQFGAVTLVWCRSKSPNRFNLVTYRITES